MTLSKRDKLKIVVVLTVLMLTMAVLLLDVDTVSVGGVFVVLLVPLLAAINRMPDEETPADSAATVTAKRKNVDRHALFDRLVDDLDGQERAYLRRRLIDTPDQRQYDS